MAFVPAWKLHMELHSATSDQPPHLEFRRRITKEVGSVPMCASGRFVERSFFFEQTSFFAVIQDKKSFIIEYRLSIKYTSKWKRIIFVNCATKTSLLAPGISVSQPVVKNENSQEVAAYSPNTTSPA
ncbi:conserved hypothetical protein, partial [Trichinella spiralis]|uniref:hypothetical protein n=1 Tax=Trichinella spiralis TaxID=6334 RepID=UPI0001EFE915